ncbi:MAG: DUF4129 domain-containing protein [Verrucomicrobia bacterium]|nr:DUF4129 domain-containing protein [Verrucomicrobiota bacterium]
MKRRQAQTGQAPLELVEESVHLLRLAPASALGAYYAGTLPFLLGVLYFWSDMSRSSFAESRLPAAALGLALLFFWMKCWQTVFANHLLSRLCGETAPRFTVRRLLRAALAQTIVQPTGLFLLPIALVLVAPFGWVYAFYQNFTVLGSGEDAGVRPVLRRAWRQAVLWPGQNNWGLIAFKVFGLFVFFNVMTGALALPFLVKMLFGVESVFTRSVGAVLNPTFFVGLAVVTHLCMDPLVKAFYVLRCFYGESLQTGQDLRTELRRFDAANKPAAIALALLALLTALPLNALSGEPQPSTRIVGIVPQFQNPAAAEGTKLGPQEDQNLLTSAATSVNVARPTRNPKPETQDSLNPADLDRAISVVIQQREYSWRFPREKLAAADKEKGTLAALVEGLYDSLRDGLKKLNEWARKVRDWLFGDYHRPARRWGLGPVWATAAKWLLVLLVVGLACVLGVIALRAWRRRRQKENLAQPIAAAPDVADENVGADQLPEDGWITLARDLLTRGELRLALRAFYLSSLAHLAEKNLLSLAKFKSNRDYERELERRRHALPEVTQTFSENVSAFDRVWYGLHEVSRESLDQFASNVERIKAQT